MEPNRCNAAFVERVVTLFCKLLAYGDEDVV